jgi:serine/threonine-protein kinase
VVDIQPANAPPNDMLSGTPYRLVRRLGQGAYGLVVEAEQVVLRRTVVIKILRRAHADCEEVEDRLRLEAQAIAALAPLTPHVVSVLDFGRTPDGRPYIVMERLEGRSLKDELAERGALPPAEAVAIAAQVLDGLAAAHDAGILHRDIKPDNVYLGVAPSGVRTVKLIDFGLAKVVRAGRPGAGPSPLAKPTDEGVMVGTPRYFAPEQARGEPAAASADLYSTGVVLYKMLTGHDPFQHCTNVYDLVIAHLTEAPRPPSATAPSFVPPALDAAVLKALAKSPLDRHADARAFRAALEAALYGPPPWWSQTTERVDGALPRPPLAIPALTLPAPSGAMLDEDTTEPQTLPIVRPRPRRTGARKVAACALAALAAFAVAVLLLVLRASRAAPAAMVPSVPPPSATAPAQAETLPPASSASALPEAEPIASAQPSNPVRASAHREPAHVPRTARAVAPPTAPPAAAPHRLFGTEP